MAGGKNVVISVDWQGGVKFTGLSRFGHTISTDGSKEAGGAEDGYQPMELLLFGLAGCTGIDVVQITQKMHQKLSGLKININAEQRDEYPKAYTKAHIEYVFRGKGLESKKIQQAIALSEEKYCSVAASMNANVKITHSFRVEEQE